MGDGLCVLIQLVLSLVLFFSLKLGTFQLDLRSGVGFPGHDTTTVMHLVGYGNMAGLIQPSQRTFSTLYILNLLIYIFTLLDTGDDNITSYIHSTDLKSQSQS